MSYVSVLSAAVAVEHQVVYGYGVAGARLGGRDRAAALDALTSHRLRRDQLARLLVERHVVPPAGEAAYALPFPVPDATAARRLAAALEDACTGAAWDVVAASAPGSEARALGVSWLADATTRGQAWRGAATAGAVLPGHPA